MVMMFSDVTTVSAYDNVTIVIDPGHGGIQAEGDSNAGCVANGLEEKNVDLITARALVDELSEYGNVTIYMTRNDDTEKSLDERVEYARSVGADYIISIHYNASANQNFFGTEIFTSAYGECYSKGNALASCIMKKWNENGGIEKGIKTRLGDNGDYYGLIRQGTQAGIPTIILEHGYLDNDHDFLRLNSEDAWKNLGVLDAQGIADYFGLEKGVVKATIAPTVHVDVPDSVVRPDETAPENVVLEVTGYDIKKGNVSFILSAHDSDGKLMYFGLQSGDVNAGTVFKELDVWEDGSGTQKGTFHVTPGYKGTITACVFNAYELFTLSNTVDLSVFKEKDEEKPAEQEYKTDAVVKSDSKSDRKKQSDSSKKNTDKVKNNSENAKTENIDDADRNDKNAGLSEIDTIISDKGSQVDAPEKKKSDSVTAKKSSKDNKSLKKAKQKKIEEEKEKRVESDFVSTNGRLTGFLILVGIIAAIVFIIVGGYMIAMKVSENRSERERNQDDY